MIETLVLLICLVVACEALTELVVKSEILAPLHLFFESRKKVLGFSFITKLIGCGYCFSVWVSTFLNLLLLLVDNPLILLTISADIDLTLKLLNLFFSVILVHRLSNYLHGISDRYFDTRKDNRYSDSLDF